MAARNRAVEKWVTNNNGNDGSGSSAASKPRYDTSVIVGVAKYVGINEVLVNQMSASQESPLLCMLVAQF